MSFSDFYINNNGKIVRTDKVIGHIGKVEENLIQGWVYQKNRIDPVEITLLANGKKITTLHANLFRQDILDKGLHPTGNCGFKVTNFDRTLLKAGTTIELVVKKRTLSRFYYQTNTQPYVVVHIPKTAGTSFRIALERKYKFETILYDYGKSSKTTSAFILDTVYRDTFSTLHQSLGHQNIKFLIGHFDAKKYFTLLEKPKIITFLRDPLQRILSEYKHKQRLDGYTHSFETFYMQESQQNKQSRFLEGVALEELFFVGLTEEYDSSIALFNQKTGANIDILALNKSKESVNRLYEISSDTVAVLEALNAKDIALYEEAKKIFYASLKEFKIKKSIFERWRKIRK